MAPLKRITPDVGFPESQGGREAYGTAWPLSEDYYLCIYDATIAAGAPGVPGNYGIYLVDAFGNKELIYRDPAIACQSPIPLRPRPMPHVMPALAAPPRHAPGTGRPAPEGANPQATLAVVNTYDSLMPWPAGTKIKALRVLQVLPMSVPSGGPPHETGARVALAGDSVVPVRHVLGTVPVEDGWQRPLHGAGQQGAVLPGVGRARLGGPVDAFGDVSAGGRTPGLPGLPRARSTASRSRCSICRWPCSVRLRRSSPTWTARIRSAIRCWCSRCWIASA